MSGQPRDGELEPIERASEDELRALQLERLQWSVHHAYQHVAPYRASCERAGVHPADLKTHADLARFPFTAKEDLRAHYPFGMLAVARERLARIHASSGTTGKSTVVAYTRRDLHTWAALVARSIASHAASSSAASSSSPRRRWRGRSRCICSVTLTRIPPDSR